MQLLGRKLRALAETVHHQMTVHGGGKNLLPICCPHAIYRGFMYINVYESPIDINK